MKTRGPLWGFGSSSGIPLTSFETGSLTGLELTGQLVRTRDYDVCLPSAGITSIYHCAWLFLCLEKDCNQVLRPAQHRYSQVAPARLE